MMSAMTADSDRHLRARNLALFQRGAPDIHARLVAARGRGRKAVPPPAQPPTVARYTIAPPMRDGVDAHTFRFLADALGRATDDGIAFFAGPRSPESYFLVVVGVGDGGPLLATLDRVRPHCVVVVEPDAAALARSLDTVDWTAVFHAVHARKGALHFLIEDDANRVSANAWRLMRRTNPAAADGFTVVGFDHPELARRVVRNLGDEARLVVGSLGFFHDELLMLANAHRNLGAPGAKVFKRTVDADRKAPAFVVGSGPSLDWSIGAIKAHAGEAVVVSCGSALRPLVTQGIVPDFQIEIENVNVSPLTEQVAREHDLAGVTLVTACTVDSDAVAAFDDVVYFFRTALSPYPLFCQSEDWSLPLPDPTVANAGLSFAQAAGFRDIYLFGVDFGSQLPDRHHAKDAFHHTPEAAAHRQHAGYDIEVEANFGGTCFTDRDLFGARDNAIEAIRVHGAGRRHFNCSDGVAIRGAAPTRPESLALETAATDKRDAVRAIVDGFVSGAALTGGWPGDDIARAIENFDARLTAALAAIEEFADRGFYAPLMDVLRLRSDRPDSPARSAADAVNVLFRGTLFGMLIFFEYYLSRVADPAHVNRFGAIARDALVRRFAEMKRQALDGLAGTAPRPPSGGVTAGSDERLPTLRRIGRNAVCPCGSGAKYKHCHGKAA